ncbi:MAG TPA: phosphatidate cytidylyltransferase [Pseudomonadota bacterium]|nr:phosphatidate cytidylyltransferase [Rhodanobacteraceae bacterium]MBP9155615.1 phosphatidate cytidylyltransferase [Xanthomonadales bacterium]HQW80495.1 phosphatidate cytidylyltransferase [Pseudomonadota bacterium]
MNRADAAAATPSSGLRERALTAVILAPLGIAAVMLLPQIWFATVLGLLFLIGVWEWTHLSGWRSTPARGVVIALHVLMFAGAWFASDTVRVQIVFSGVLFWLLAPWWLRHYHFGERTSQRSLAIKTLACALAIVPAWTAAIVLHGGERGPWWVLFLLVLVWCADSCAYFAGRRFGTTKLAPNISPGKTTAGVYGALVGCTFYALGLGHFVFAVPAQRLLIFVALCIVTMLFSIVGDLLESLIKRHAQAKDSGTLFPGHGGALDRFDSMFAALPIFVAGKLILGL